MKEQIEKVREARKRGESPPPVSNYIGKCFLDIAVHTAYRPNFSNYSFRDEMISDAVENCLQYYYNFDPDNEKLNPFGYFSLIVWRAFVRRIWREKKEAYVKYKSYEMANVSEQLTSEDLELIPDDVKSLISGSSNYENISEFIRDFEEKEKERKLKKKKPSKKKDDNELEVDID